jgi:hypothetical protein
VPVAGRSVVVVEVSPIGGGVCNGVDAIVDSMASCGSGGYVSHVGMKKGDSGPAQLTGVQGQLGTFELPNSLVSLPLSWNASHQVLLQYMASGWNHASHRAMLTLRGSKSTREGLTPTDCCPSAPKRTT